MSGDDTLAGPMRVDIASDVVCPWCVIGWKQLERAIEASGLEVEVRWHPFELNPRMPAEGQNLREHIQQKYGTTPAQSERARERIATLGAELGFEFRYADDMRMQNTFRAHQLLHYGQLEGVHTPLEMALFRAYFTDHRDLTSPDVLAEVAAEVGLDGDAAREAIVNGGLVDVVRARQVLVQQQGITAVPAVVVDGRYLVVGAQGEAAYEGVLRRAAGERAEVGGGDVAAAEAPA